VENVLEEQESKVSTAERNKTDEGKKLRALQIRCNLRGSGPKDSELKGTGKSELWRVEKEKSWLFCVDRWKSQRRGVEQFHPLHAQYMQPNLWAFKGEKGKPQGSTYGYALYFRSLNPVPCNQHH
jgi:hypothetical protein